MIRSHSVEAGSRQARTLLRAVFYVYLICIKYITTIDPVHVLLQPLLASFDLEGVAQLIKAGKAQKIVVMAGKYQTPLCSSSSYILQHSSAAYVLRTTTNTPEKAAFASDQM